MKGTQSKTYSYVLHENGPIFNINDGLNDWDVCQKKKTNEGISSYLGINNQVFGNLMIGEQAESLCHP